MLVVRRIISYGFSLGILIVVILTYIFVLPVVVIREKFTLKKPKQAGSKVVALLILSPIILALAGCTSVSVGGNAVRKTVDSAGRLIDRSAEFASTAAPALYAPQGDLDTLESTASAEGLMLTGEQLQLILGAADIYSMDPALLALVVEREITWLDSGELDRDILQSLSGKDASIGIAQVRVTTAEEIETNDRADVFPEFLEGDESRTERIRRLASDDWSILYSAAYLDLLGQRFGSSDPYALADRYTGRTPRSTPTDEQQKLYNLFHNLF